MLDWVYVSDVSNLWKQHYNRINQTHLFLSVNKYCNRKESSLATYYCIRRKLTVFLNIPLRSPLSKTYVQATTRMTNSTIVKI